MIVEYFEKERKEFEKLFTDEVLEKAKEKIFEELEEIKIGRASCRERV